MFSYFLKSGVSLRGQPILALPHQPLLGLCTIRYFLSLGSSTLCIHSTGSSSPTFKPAHIGQFLFWLGLHLFFGFSAIFSQRFDAFAAFFPTQSLSLPSVFQHPPPSCLCSLKGSWCCLSQTSQTCGSPPSLPVPAGDFIVISLLECEVPEVRDLSFTIEGPLQCSQELLSKCLS